MLVPAMPGDNAAAEPDCYRNAYFSPFVTLERLFRAGLISGVFLRNGRSCPIMLPFARVPLRGVCFGGYLHSELLRLCSEVPDWDGFHEALMDNAVTSVRAESPETDASFTSLCAALEGKGWRIRLEQGKRSPYLDFPASREQVGFYEFFRKANAKECRNLLASRRKMEAAHTVSMEFLSRPIDEELASHLSAVEQKGWKKDFGIFSETKRKYTMALFGDAVLEFGLLYFDGNLVAWDIDVRSGTILYSYNRAYDAGYAALAPGKVLHYETLKRAYETGINRVYIMGGEDAFKMCFTTGSVQRIQMEAFSPGIFGKGAELCFAAKRRLTRFLRHKRN